MVGSNNISLCVSTADSFICASAQGPVLWLPGEAPLPSGFAQQAAWKGREGKVHLSFKDTDKEIRLAGDRRVQAKGLPSSHFNEPGRWLLGPSFTRMRLHQRQDTEPRTEREKLENSCKHSSLNVVRITFS